MPDEPTVQQTSALDRNLRYATKQIEKLVDTMVSALEHHINAEACALLENAEKELSELRTSYSSTVNRILQKCSDEEFEQKCESLTTAQNKLFETCRAIVAKSQAEVAKYRGKRARESLVSQPGHSTEMSSFESNSASHHYPKIKIPTFNGDYRQFMRFKGIFENLVHDEVSIPNVRKLYYLQDALEGEAALLIEDLPMCDASYVEAWSRITTRYDNQKALVMIYFRELLSIKKIAQPHELRSLLDSVTNALNNLKLCNLPADNWGDLVAYMVYQCLDEKTRDDFDNSQSESTKFFGWNVLLTFLRGRAYSNETRKLADLTVARFSSGSSTGTVPKKPKEEKPKPAGPKASFVTTSQTNKCIACGDSHLLIACQAFAAKTPKERFTLVARNKMCTNCFSRAHRVKECTGRGKCKICSQPHHTLLHFPQRNSMGPTPSAVNAANQPTSSASAADLNASLPVQPSQSSSANLVCSKITSSAAAKTIILPTAVVRFECQGIVNTARVLLDSCSQVTFISEDFVRKFQLPFTKKRGGCSSFTGASSGVVRVETSCALSLISRFSSFRLPIVADVVPQTSLTYGINGVQFPAAFQAITGIALADPAFATNPVHVPKPDILIGAEYFERCILNETKSLDTLTLRNSNFGWVLIGPVYSQPASFCALISSPPVCSYAICQIEAQLRRFCELEEVNAPDEDLTDEKTECVRHFEETHSRAPDGKFVARYPLQLPRERLVGNFVRAQRNLFWSEKKRDSAVQPEYVEFMREYERLEHMTPIAFQKAEYYIPHHAVVRPSSSTTRTRVVFNASSKTASGYSLNDLMMVGPTIQPELFDTLLRFRKHRFAFTADIAKMYRCIWIHDDDRSLQCILWRESADQPVKVYQLNTLTYGTAAAPFIATKCLDALAKAVQEQSPEAAAAISSHFYMDDFLSGAETLEECKSLQQKVHGILASAGFKLRKYQSNSAELLATIDPILVESSKETTLGRESANLLGVYWSNRSDTFSVRVSKPLEMPAVMTRRLLLSEISKTFDPLGVAAPVTIRAKIFMQRVWRESGSWDEPISSSLAVDFAAYWRDISDLDQFEIPRAYTELSELISCRLIGFCDASELAYCAVLYLRCEDRDGAISVNFVCAKTRVAPLKHVSIPRLELQAAWLLTQLASRVSPILGVDISEMCAFSDAQVVLSWLAKPPSTWTKFVRNRVAKIVETLPFERWSYVNTSVNPADLATRGLTVSKFLSSKLWTNGPDFLRSDFSIVVDIDESLELEKRKVKPVCNVVVSAELEFLMNLVNNSSSYTRVVRTFAFIFRFFNNCRSKVRTRGLLSCTPLNADELSFAESRVIFVVQHSLFAAVFACLLQGVRISKKSGLRALNPYIDERQLLRVGGRLRNSDLPAEEKHPVILPAKCHFVELLIRHYHHCYFHAQKSFLLAHLRPKFWFYGNLTSVVKKCLRQCVTCTRYDSAPANQLMGDLPAARVTVSRPFTRVGVDFAGPFKVKCVGHRSTIEFKSYVAVFVCLATRAVHLEVVSQLSTDHFLLSLSRFIARRGRPFLIWSDNGSNFVGAAAYLNLAESGIADYLADQGIRWIFNPPRAPHRGGIWESAVKSMKKHLLRSTDGQLFTFEELSTVVSRVEAILNSRPLIVKVDRDQEKTVLTPGHFLIGDSLLSDPVPATNPRLAKRYEIVSRVTATIWRRWRQDYLAQLQTRNKWQTVVPNVTIGSIVILRDPTSTPNSWPLGRIVGTYPDAVGHVRTVDVMVAGTVKRRDLSSIVLLIEEPSESSEPLVQPGEC